jgi:hypothetical protein
MPSPSRDPGAAPSYALRVWRVEQGTSWFIRTLSASYGGLLTHWARGRSLYCDPDGCSSPYHKQGSVWKGYCTAELWDAVRKRWNPIVWEITETAEVDMRGIFARGQTWFVERPEETEKKRRPVRAKLHELGDPGSIPPPLDYLPVLRALYHVPTLTATVRNPMPDRVMVTPSEGAAPSGLDQGLPVVDVCHKKTSEVEAELKAKGILSPNGRVNGRH